MIQPALEWLQQDVVVGVARAFRKNQQIRAAVDGFRHLQHRRLRLAALPRDQHHVEYFQRDKAAQRRFQPVIGGGDRAQLAAQNARQRHPNQHEIAVAVVVGVIDATGGGAFTQLRQRLGVRAGQENHQRREELVQPDGEEREVGRGGHGGSGNVGRGYFIVVARACHTHVRRSHRQPHPAPGEAVGIAERVENGVFAQHAVLAFGALIERETARDGIMQRQVFVRVEVVKLRDKRRRALPLGLRRFQLRQERQPFAV